MLTNIVSLLAIVGQPAPAIEDSFERALGFGLDRPRVEVWTTHGDNPFHAGQRARVFVRSDRDAYVTVFRVDTDGRVRVLFPREPWEDGFVRGGREFEIEGTHDDAFEVDDYPGVGYLFAVSASDPFDYEPVTTGDHWDYRQIADGRVRGDPYVALTDLAQRIVPDSYSDWDYDITPYYVEQRYDYPRFLCYDCHSYASYSYWNPYAYSCVRFRIVVFDDPYYYPYRYYGGTRVVFNRPFRPQPRFIFKDRAGFGDDRFVTHERERPVNDNGRRGVRGADLGGRGAIPVPSARERRGGTLFGDPRRGERPQPTRRDQPAQSDGQRRLFDRQRNESDSPARPSTSDTRSEAPSRQPNPDTRPDDQRRRSGERREGNRSSPTTERPAPEVRPPRSREESRPEPRVEPRRAEPRNEPKGESRPRAEPRREKDKQSSGDRAKGQPELRRRRPE